VVWTPSSSSLLYRRPIGVAATGQLDPRCWVRLGCRCWLIERLGLLPPFPRPFPSRHLPSPLLLGISACCWPTSARSGDRQPIWRTSCDASLGRLVPGSSRHSSLERRSCLCCSSPCWLRSPWRLSLVPQCGGRPLWLSAPVSLMGRGHRLTVAHAARTLAVRVVASGVGGDVCDHHRRLPD
jgi:hypothetical protein